MRISDWSSNVCSSDLKKELDATFGDWKAPATPKPVKHFEIAVPKPQPRILLVDRPKSPQSVILAGKVLGVKGGDGLAVLRAAHDIFGVTFLSRLKMNLSATTSGSYCVRTPEIVRTSLRELVWL